MKVIKSSEWDGMWSLADYLVYLEDSAQKDSDAYRTLVKFYGQDKIDQICKEHREKRSREPGDDDD